MSETGYVRHGRLSRYQKKFTVYCLLQQIKISNWKIEYNHYKQNLKKILKQENKKSIEKMNSINLQLAFAAC